MPILVDKYHISSIGLFGSVVRDDFSPTQSDIDIIVDFSQPFSIEFIDVAELLKQMLKNKSRL